MQTFLAYSNFAQAASVLDRSRLGKQRAEVIQILNALTGVSKGWVNHPATRMWKGHEQALVQYGLAICLEWISRGYKDTCYDKIKAFYVSTPVINPIWLGGIIHKVHRSVLLLKDEAFYSQYGWSELPKAQDYWPVP
jgi:hypothetical protein